MISSQKKSIAIPRLLVASLLALAFVTSYLMERAQEAKAHNDTCISTGGGWWCEWYDTSLPSSTRHWFNAAITKRNWLMGQVWDTYENSMQKKCVKIKDEDGVIHQIACGSGSPSGNIAASQRPGWMFNYHWADGNRFIGANASHPKG